MLLNMGDQNVIARVETRYPPRTHDGLTVWLGGAPVFRLPVDRFAWLIGELAALLEGRG